MRVATVLQVPVSLLPLLLCFSWMVEHVHSIDSSSLRSNSNSNGNGKSLPTNNHNDVGRMIMNNDKMMEELKGLVSQFVDARIDSFEDMIRSQNDVIDDLRKKVVQLEKDNASSSSLHRLLQSSSTNKDDIEYCLPKFVQTARGGRCDVLSVTRFQNETYFNDDAIFNENVEFDTDSDCMPTFNRTTKMCRFNNNITFDEGNILFNSTGNHSLVQFENNKTEFGRDIQFREDTTVRFESDVSFNNGGQVNFNKQTTFTEDVTIENKNHDVDFRIKDKVGISFDTNKHFDVHTPTQFTEDVVISNSDHDIDFTVEDKVKVLFNIHDDHYVEFESYPLFHEPVKMEKNLEVKGELRVRKKSKLEDVESNGWFWVGGKTYLDGTLEAKDGVTIKKGGVIVESGGVQVHDGIVNVTRGNLDVHGVITADYVVIDGQRNANTNNDQPAHDDDRGVVVIVPTPAELLTVKGGNAKIDGTLTADTIRSGNINLDDSTIIDDIINKLQDYSLTLKVNRIEANTADIGGTLFPIYDELYGITSEKIVQLLEDQNLQVKTLVTERATIGDQKYPFTVDDIVNELITYEDVVTIPKLQSIELDVIPTILTENGIMREVPGTMKLNGDNVATVQDIPIVELTRSTSITTDEIVSALEGAAIKVSSVEASSSLMVADVAVATMDDVTVIVNKAIDDNIIASSSTESSSSCTCERSDIESIVTTEYVRDMIDEDYIRDAAVHVHGDDTSGGDDDSDCNTCSEDFVRATITSEFIQELGFSTAIESESSSSLSSCVCNINDYDTEIKDMINSSYITDLGFMITTDVDEEDRIKDIVNAEYISAICPCGSGGE